MSKRAIVVLAILVVALGAYIALFERTSLTSKELGERQGKVLKSFVRAKVDRLEIQRKGRNVVLERDLSEGSDLSGFHMLEPDKIGADDDAVDRVLGELEWLSARRTFENLSVQDVQRFGLDKPRYRVAYRAGGDRHVLAVGNPDVHGEGVYVRVDQDHEAFVVPKTLVETLDHEPLHYRDKEFLGEMTVAWAQRLELEGAGKKGELAKEGGRFYVLGQVKSYADDRRVEELLRALDDLRATRFLEGDAAKQAESTLAKPARVVRLRIVPDQGREDREPMLVELTLGGECPGQADERVARGARNTPPVCIAADSAKAFELDADALRLSRPFAADLSAIERIDLVRGTSKLSLKREGEKWLADSKAPIDREAVEQWLEDLGKERALGFVAPRVFNEQASVTLHLVEDKQERLALGQLTPEGVLVKRGDEPAMLTFPASLFDALEPSARRFQPLEPWGTHQPSEVVSLEVREGSTRRALVLDGGTWKAGGTAAKDSDAVRELVRRLMKLRVRAFVRDQPRPEHGLANPVAELRLKLQDGSTLTLLEGAASDRGSYVRIDERGVFEVGTEVSAQLKALAGTAPMPTAAAAQPGEGEGEEDEEDHDELGHDELGHDEHEH